MRSFEIVAIFAIGLLSGCGAKKQISNSLPDLIIPPTCLHSNVVLKSCDLDLMDRQFSKGLVVKPCKDSFIDFGRKCAIVHYNSGAK